MEGKAVVRERYFQCSDRVDVIISTKGERDLCFHIHYGERTSCFVSEKYTESNKKFWRRSFWSLFNFGNIFKLQKF
jgi:hypothetical protein